MMQAIKTKKQNKQALCRIQELMKLNAPVNSDEYNELEVLSILVENYEAKAFPIDLPDPVAAIEFRMEQLQFDATDLAKILGSKSRASEILNKKRKLSLSMIRKLHKDWQIPTESLIQAY